MDKLYHRKWEGNRGKINYSSTNQFDKNLVDFATQKNCEDA
jgi:hypothetical protein